MKAIKNTVLAAGLFIIAAMLLVQPTWAMDADALAKETEAYVASTAPSRPTPPDVVVGKVKDACKVLSAEGQEAFPKFKGNGSNFLYEGTYIWIHTLSDATMLMHPIKHKMEGKALMGLKDVKGKRLFSVMNAVVKDQGEGWVTYDWPKPGSKDIVKKVSFVKGCTMPDGTEIVIGSGLYNFTDETLKGLTIH